MSLVVTLLTWALFNINLALIKELLSQRSLSRIALLTSSQILTICHYAFATILQYSGTGPQREFSVRGKVGGRGRGPQPHVISRRESD